ncbi:MAG TPA: menaquinone biosynthesis decarboxylase [Deinococcales bacterium]|nr:menaquinone biosynthesis decarboxylase [Deinococcales bacterium]
MAHGDLHRFIDLLESRGELVRVREPVSHDLEITEIADRTVKGGGPALLFEKVVGKDFPLVIGLYGTRRRMEMALGVQRLDEIAERIRSLAQVKMGGGLLGMASNLPKLRELTSLPPRRVTRAPVQEVVWSGDDVDLGRLPVLKCWPQDGGPFITLPLVISRDPETRELNIGMYRMQVFDRNTTGMHWQRHKVGARHLEKARRMGRKLEVAVALGGDPALTYAATAPLPPVPGINEFSLTGFLRGQRVNLVKGVTVDLEVPADAEFILEGYVDPEEAPRTEGPFGDHTGFYTLEDLYPAFHVTAVTMRRNAIYPATIVGRPPMEDAYLIEASERIFLAPAQMIIPEIHDYAMPPVGVAHNLVNVSIDKQYPGQAYKVANGLLGLGQMMFAKVVMVVDKGAPVQDTLSCLRFALARAVPGRDTLFTRGPMDVLDHSSRSFSYGGKLIIDGTTKRPEEGGPALASLSGARDATDLPAHPLVAGQAQPGGGVWFVTTAKREAGQGARLGAELAASPAARGIRLLAVVDDDTDASDPDDVLWTLLNNIDPERDGAVVQGPNGPVLVLDGTRKIPEEGFHRGWPDKIVMDPAVVRRVDEIWPRLGIKLPGMP